MSLCYELLFRGHNFQKVRHPKTKYQLPSLRCNVWSSLDVFILSRIFPQPQYKARQLYLTSDSYSCPDVGLVPSLHHIQCPLLFSCANITKISASCLPHNTQNYIFFFYNIREKFCAVRILLRLFTSSLTKIIESLK